MPTPKKPFSVLSAEKKSHKTKAELKTRESGEKALATGAALKERPEVRDNPRAHAEFERLSNLLEKIGKNDAIYEGVINRYCLLQAECHGFEEMRDRMSNELEALEQAEGMSAKDYFSLKIDIQKQIIALDKQIQTKRKMLLDIEKENIMTIAAALRSIPKPEEKASNKLLEVLNGS
ncbi:hypothetical protein [Ectobacillus ponti]|uniref:Uncharacterized protein n=1 Tax=Ectobacillus ponti TaxID=2961894 RepID=A0AA42BRP6_9BACI|nr:hypothetical protein [Ectobacillus ponti]MCP8969714.1 hypothetical protein [Ectobacillus ponti]